MPKYAGFESTGSAPSPVTGWYDTDNFSYASLPAPANLLAITSDQFNARMNGLWAVSSGALVAYTPPAPTVTGAQVAASAYMALIGGGLSVTSTGTPAMNGVYRIDAQAQSLISAEAQFIGAFSEFTNGSSASLVWPYLLNGGSVTFASTTEFMAFAKAAGQIVAAANLALAQATAMPSASVTIP